MADRAHSTSRRALLAGLTTSPALARPLAAFSLSAAAGAGAVAGAKRALGAEVPAPHPDAALLALEPRLTAMARALDGLRERSWRLEEEGHAAVAPKPASADHYGPAWEGWRAALRAGLVANGHAAADRAARAAGVELIEAVRALEAIPARTLDGLRVKARMNAYGGDDLTESIVADLLAMDGSVGGTA